MAEPDDIDALLREIEAATGGAPKPSSGSSSSSAGQVVPVGSPGTPEAKGAAGADGSGSRMKSALIGGGLAAAGVSLVAAPLYWLIPGHQAFPAALGAFLGASGMALFKDRKPRG